VPSPIHPLRATHACDDHAVAALLIVALAALAIGHAVGLVLARRRFAPLE
jgi:uncharacterized protein (DUF58 family)